MASLSDFGSDLRTLETTIVSAAGGNLSAIGSVLADMSKLSSDVGEIVTGFVGPATPAAPIAGVATAHTNAVAMGEINETAGRILGHCNAPRPHKLGDGTLLKLLPGLFGGVATWLPTLLQILNTLHPTPSPVAAGS